MLEARSLTRHYGTTTAVRDVSFRIADSEIVGLLGHNGAGKTTVMRMLSGYLEPHAGSVGVDGLELAQRRRSIQQQLGYLPENLPVYPEMSVADYLDYTATLRGIAARQRPQQVREALQATDLRALALRRIGELSRGMRQRVGVAQAIINRPRLLILDEPTNGLDPQQTEQMRALIQRLAERATVILSTHILQEVDAVCDRVLVLRQGSLVLDSSLEQLRHTNTLLLQTDDRAADLAAYLARLPQVASLQQTDGSPDRRHFALRLRDNTERDTAASNVARCVVNAGASLYQLQFASRDLATVLHESGGDGD